MRQLAAANTTIQTLIPDEYRGRTMALYSMTVVGLAPFGSLAAGALAGSFRERVLRWRLGGAAGVGRQRRPSVGPSGEIALRVKAVVLTLLLFERGGSGPNRRAPANSVAWRAESLSELATISGLKLRHPVPCDFITKEKVNEFLKKRVKDTTTPEEIRAEELTLKKFGLVPPDFNLADTTVDLLTEQAAAFYDYDKKSCSSPRPPRPTRRNRFSPTSLSHAIADQNFNLAHFIRQGRKSDDGCRRTLGGDGRPGHLADVRVPGSPARPVAKKFPGAGENHEPPEPGGRAISGLRSGAALSAPHAGVSVYRRHGFPKRRDRARRRRRVRRSFPARARLHAADPAPARSISTT